VDSKIINASQKEGSDEAGIGETLKNTKRGPFQAASHTLQNSPP